MADNFKFLQTQPYSLAGSGAIIGATSIILKSMTDIDGNLVVFATSFGTKGFATIQPGQGISEEQISFTGITQNSNGTATLTGVSSVTFGYPYTATSGLMKTHAGSTSLIISNTSGFYDELTSKDDDETVNGLWTFIQPPISTTNPTGSTQVANKAYVDGVAFGVGVLATDTVYGYSKLSVAAASPTVPIVVGTNDGRVPTQGENDALVGNNTDIAVGTGNKFVTQTGLQHNAEKYAADTSASSTAYVVTLSPVPTSYTAGMVVYAKIVNANTTTTPTINVNGLGAKTIVKVTSTPLVIGDIAANMFCTFIYDGTNMVLQTPVAISRLYSNGVNSFTGASATQTVTHNLTGIPKRIIINAYSSGNNSVSAVSVSTGSSNGFWDVSGQGCAYVAISTNSVSATSNTQAVFVEAIASSGTSPTFHGIIGNVTSTSFDIVWTTNTGNGTVYFSWAAEN